MTLFCCRQGGERGEVIEDTSYRDERRLESKELKEKQSISGKDGGNEARATQTS